MTSDRLNEPGQHDLYRVMQLIRRTELRLAKSCQQGLVHGACHTYVGQEAVAAGVCAPLRKDDVIFSTHRGHGHALAKGVPPEQLIAELYGRQSGCSFGRGGSMHLFSPERGLLGTSGIVGPSMLQATGAGYSFKVLQTDRVAVAFFGDGAVNNGAFHEALNMASIWNLPVLFVCENNGFATEIPFGYASGNPSVADRGSSYGIEAVQVDGNNVTAVYQTTVQALERARGGEGATLIECVTYRTRAHAEGMGDFTYRSREEVDSWKDRCPILALRNQLENTAPLDSIDSEIQTVVDEAHEAAQAAPYPHPETATLHVYGNPKPSASDRFTPTEPTLESHRSSGSPAREISFVEATWEALADAMEHDPSIFVLGEGIGKRGGNFNTTAGLYDRYGPVRLCDTPICERGFVGLSVGAAMAGGRPVVDFMFADFILDGVGEILNQMAKMQYMSSGRLTMPVLLRGCIGIGHSASTHHSGNYYALYAQFPGLRVVVPSTPYDAKGLFTRALNSPDPVLFLEHRELLQDKSPVPETPYQLPFGQSAIVRPGDHVTIVALAAMVRKCATAAQQLEAEGVSVEIIDPRTIAPLDAQTIVDSLEKTGRLLVVDEAFESYGFGAEIAAQVGRLGFNHLDAPIHRLNGASTPTPYSPSLEKAIVPQVEEIIHAVRNLLEE